VNNLLNDIFENRCNANKYISIFVAETPAGGVVAFVANGLRSE
jgi:hypothetical protein